MVESYTDHLEELKRLEYPELYSWEPIDNEIFYVYTDGVVRAKYEELLGLAPGNKLSLFIIDKNHYKERMDDICKHINYFLSFFDTEHELFTSTLSIKFIIDQNPDLKMGAFKKLIETRVITDSFIQKIRAMTSRLYQININTDEDGKYKNTPKLTNDHARQIVSVSFAIRCILPLCVHYSDTNNNFVNKKDYIDCFDKIFMMIIKKFENDDIAIFNAICRFVKFRVDRAYTADMPIWEKKKQLYGIVESTYLEEVIHEVILVKSLHKLEYNRSVVSFIDGVIFSFHSNFKIENFKFKPVEIEPVDASSDDDNHLSHAEAIEMSVYRVDESNQLINEANAKQVIRKIENNFNIDISTEEFEFYLKNIKRSAVTQMFLHSFYSRFFHDSYAIYNLNDATVIKLLIYLKKYLQLRGMTILPQLCTAKVRGKFKDNSIKNSKFIEKIDTSSIYINSVLPKFRYIKELNPKEDLIKKRWSAFINSTFEFVDFNPEINGIVYDDVDVDLIIHELSLFFSII